MSFIDEKTQQFYDDLDRRLKAAEEEAERQKRENKTIDRIRQAGSIIRSVANLYWTTKGAPPQDISSPTDISDESDEQIARQRERMLKAHESLARLRMADAKANADIDYADGRRRNEERRTNAMIDYQQNRENNENKKTEAEIDNIHSRTNLANRQAALANEQTRQRQIQNENLPQQQQQEAEIRRARAQQSWNAARRNSAIRPRTRLSNRRRRR